MPESARQGMVAEGQLGNNSLDYPVGGRPQHDQHGVDDLGGAFEETTSGR